MLYLLDKLFFVSHALLIVFILLGWVWRRARWLHLVATGLTTFSWFVLGAVHGIGYCFLTDWHRQVRRQMGRQDAGSSYLELLASEVFGITTDRVVWDWVGGGLFALMLAVTATVWLREWWRWTGRRASRCK